ncbi:hypothetical protein AX15_007757 [Amanita polypyramis BW_CC]|nr:hypothetical protein AX15_007757 [Amanita polypyramis BW_CC]
MLLPTSVLPSALLELTFIRAAACMNATRIGTFAAGQCCRRFSSRLVRQLHNEALATTPPPGFYHAYGQSHYAPSIEQNDMPQVPLGQAGPLSELERRIQALEEVAVKESQALEPPSYTEEELTAFYEDLLAIPTAQLEPDPGTSVGAPKQGQDEEDLSVISTIERRLLGDFPREVGYESSDVQDIPTSSAVSETETLSAFVSQPYLRVLAHLQEIVSRLEAVQGPLATPSIGVVSIKECELLVRVCLRAQDHSAAENTLDLMKRIGVPLPANAITNIMHSHADAGDIAGIERVMEAFLTDTPNEQQRHLHVKAHLLATPTDAIPTTALQVLHSYELKSHPAPIKTYTSTITSLFSKPSSLAHAQAWDLFSHMRYVAHPEPDVLLYRLMIRACATPITSSRSSEPERALDLWTEMTVDRQVIPTADTYNAVILACAKSGLRRYVNEAFRLAKEMLDSHRDARGRVAFRPDRKTFCALLEGAKRVGDLARARWILAEMVRGVGPDGHSLDGEVDASINEEVMMHVFHAYAAYNPPFVRSIAPLAKGDTNDLSLDESVQAENVSEESENVLNTSDGVDSGPPVPEDPYPAFTHIPPQSRQEVVHEVRTLFHRILADAEGQVSRHDWDDTMPSERKFQHVTLTTRLINSYLSVFYRHSSLEKSREIFWKVYDKLGVERSARSYVDALERCGRARKGRERQVAYQFARELWAKWETMEQSMQDGDRPLNPRLVEKAHTALMRTLAL